VNDVAEKVVVLFWLRLKLIQLKKKKMN